jgi:hypothetical protein
MNHFHLLRPFVVVLAVVGSVIFSARASAEERDYRLHGTAMLVDGIVTGTGNATHLGNYTEVGIASISETGHVEGCVILTGVRGDEIWETISGQLDPSTGMITATVTYIGGTGRFEGASGSAILLAQIGPDGISVVVAGTIDY